MDVLNKTNTLAIEQQRLRQVNSKVLYLYDDIPNNASETYGLYKKEIGNFQELFFNGQQLTQGGVPASYWILNGNTLSTTQNYNIDFGNADVGNIGNLTSIVGNIQTINSTLGNITNISSTVGNITNINSSTIITTDIKAKEIELDPTRATTTSNYKLYRFADDNRVYFGINQLGYQDEILFEFDNVAETRIRPKVAGNSDYPALTLKGKLLDGTKAVAILTHSGSQFVGSGTSSDYYALNYSTENSANYSYPYLYSVGYNGVNKNPVSPFRYKLSSNIETYESQYLVNMNNFNLANVGVLNANIGYFNTISKLASETGDIDVLRAIDMNANDLNNVGNMNTGNINLQNNNLTNVNNADFGGAVSITGSSFTGGSGIDTYVDNRADGVLQSATNITNFFNSNIDSVPIGAFPLTNLYNVIEANDRTVSGVSYDGVVKTKHLYATGDITADDIYAQNFYKKPQSGDVFDFLGSTGGALIKAGAQVIGSATLAAGMVFAGGLIAVGSLEYGGEETFYVVNNGSNSQYPAKMEIAKFYGTPSGDHSDYWFGHKYGTLLPTLNIPEQSAQSGTEVIYGYGLDPLSNRLTITNIPVQTEDESNPRSYSHNVYYGDDPMGLLPDIKTQCYNSALSMTHEYFYSIELKNYSDDDVFQNQATSWRAGTSYRTTQSLPGTNRLYSKGGNLWFNDYRYRKQDDNQFIYGIQLPQYTTASASNLLYQNNQGYLVWADGGGTISRIMDESIIGNYALPLTGGTLTGNLAMTDSTDTFTFNVGSGFLNINQTTNIANFNDFNINLNKSVYFGGLLVLSGDANDVILTKTGADNKSLLIQAGDNTGSGTDDYEIIFKTRDSGNVLYTAMDINGKDEQINFYKNTQHRTGVITIYDTNNNPFNTKNLENIGGVLYWGGSSFSSPWTTDAINDRISTTFQNLQLGNTNGTIQNSLGVVKFGYTSGSDVYVASDSFYIYQTGTTTNPLLTANTGTSQVDISGNLVVSGNISNSVLSANTSTSQVDITGDLVVSGTISGNVSGLTFNTSQITADSDLDLQPYDLYCNEAFPNSQCKINFGTGSTAGSARLYGDATYADVSLSRNNGSLLTNLFNSSTAGGLIVDRTATPNDKRLTVQHDGTDSIVRGSNELKLQGNTKINIGKYVGTTHTSLTEIEEVSVSRCDMTLGSGITWTSVNNSNIRLKGYDDEKRIQFDYNDGVFITDPTKVRLTTNFTIGGVEVIVDTLEANANSTFRDNGTLGIYESSSTFAMWQTNGQMTTERGGLATWYLGNGAFGGWSNGNADWAAGHSALRFASNKSNGNFYIGGSLTQNSDRRIKKNIEPIPDNESLTMLEKIEAYTYNYIDETRGKEKVYGWIAQDVREHFPQATGIMKQQIPNIMLNITINKNKIILPSPFDIEPNTQILIQNLKDFDYSNKQIIVEKKVSSQEYLINQELEDTTGFLYGVFVDDFITIEKEKLVPILWSATQEINRKVEMIENKDAEIDKLKTYVAQQEVAMCEMKVKIARIEELLLRNNIK